VSPWENYHLEWSADPLTVTSPAWQDITAYARAPSGPPIHVTGGVPTMGSAGQPTTMTVSLDNTDHRFTFGNTGSPLYGSWKPGRRIRYYETVGNRRFDEFTGYIQPPETNDWADLGVDQYMTVTAVDRLGWLGTARAFMSTLTEHILYNGGADLVYAWTLADPGPGFRPYVGSAPLLADLFTIPGTPAPPSMLAYQTRSGPPGDDLQVPTFTPLLGPAGVTSYARAVADVTVNVASGQKVAVSAWVYLDDPNDVNQPSDYLVRLLKTSTGDQVFLYDDPFAVAVGGATYGGSLVNVFSGKLDRGAWHLLTVRADIPSGAVDFWIDRATVASGTMSGSPPSSMSFDTVIVGQTTFGSVAQVRVYVGSDPMPASAHLALYAMGFSGLAGQSTGARVTTLAQYAGVPTAELGLIDPGVALMQRATLAGKTPLAAMREAETTEQGRLRTNGQGLLVFDPRTRRYNS
jgi:hypothetical protein